MPFVDITITCPHCGEVVTYEKQPSSGIFRKRCNSCIQKLIIRTDEGKVIKVKKE